MSSRARATPASWLLVFSILIPACAAGPSDFQARSGAELPEWIPLFDGESLDGWTPKFTGHPLGLNLHDSFRVEDGVLKVDYSGYAGEFDGRFGHLFHEREFSHYRLRLEYRFTGEQMSGGPGWAWRNNGVMVHGQSPQSMGLHQEFPVSIEVQLLGGGESGERSTANLCTPGTNVVIGDELVTQHCVNSESATYRGDGWVRAEIVVRGAQSIEHFVEGQLVMRYAAPQLDPRDADAQALIGETDTLLLSRGTISLQAESHPCEFRKIELLVLDAATP